MPDPKQLSAIRNLAASAAITSPHFIAAMPGAIRNAEFPDQTFLGAMSQDLDPYKGIDPNLWGTVEPEGVFGRDPEDDSSATGTYLRNMLAQFGPALQESMERLPLGERAWHLDEMVHEFAEAAGVPWAAQLLVDVITPGLEGAVLSRMGRVPNAVNDSEIAEKAIAIVDEAKAPPGETDMTRRGFLKASGAVASAVVGLGGARAAKVAGKVASKAPRVIKELSKAALRAKEVPFIAARRTQLMDSPIRDLMELVMRRGMEDAVRPHRYGDGSRATAEDFRPGAPMRPSDVTGRAVSDDADFDYDMRQLVEEMEEAGIRKGVDPSAPDSEWTPESLNQHREEAARTMAAIDTDQAIDILKTMGYRDKDIDALIDHGADTTEAAFAEMDITEIAFSEVDALGDPGSHPGPHPGRGASGKFGVMDGGDQMDGWISRLADHFEDTGNESFFQWTAAEHAVDALVDADLYDLGADSTPRNPYVRYRADEAHRPHFTEEDWKLEGDVSDATESWMHAGEPTPIPSRFDADGMPAESPNPFPEDVKGEYEEIMRMDAEVQEAAARHEAAQAQVDKPLVTGPEDPPPKSFEDALELPEISRRGALIGAGITAAGAAGAGALSRAAKRAGEAVTSIVKPAEAAVQAPRVLSRAAQVASNNQAVGSIRRNLMNETIEELFHKVMRKGVKREARDAASTYPELDARWEAREWDDDTLDFLGDMRDEYDADSTFIDEWKWGSWEDANDPNRAPTREAINDLESEQARDILLEMGYDESALATAEEAGAQWALDAPYDGYNHPDDHSILDLFDEDGAHADEGPWAIHGRGDFMSLDDKFGMSDGSGTEMYRMDMYDPVSTPSNPHYDVDPADSKSFEEVGRPDAMFDDQGMPVRTREEVRKSLDLEPDEHAGMLEKAESAPEAKPDAPEGGLSRRDMLKGSGALAVTAAAGGLSRGLSKVAGASTEIPITTVAKAAENVPVSAVRRLVNMGSRQISERLSNMVYGGRWVDGSDESKEIIDELAVRGFDELEIDNRVAGLRDKPVTQRGSDYEASLEDGWEDSLRTVEDAESRVDPRRGEYEDPEDDLGYSPLYRRPRGGLMYPPPVSPGSYSAYLS